MLLPRLTLLQYDLLILTLAWFIGFAPILRRREWPWTRGLGLTLIATAFTRLLIDATYGIADLFETTINGGYVVLGAIPTSELWATATDHLRDFVLIPLAGAALYYGYERVDGKLRYVLPRRIDTALAELGLTPRTSPLGDAAAGATLFLPVALAYLAASILLTLTTGLFAATGDESHVWDNLTPLLIVVLAGAAGVSEEFLFRGILLSALERRWGLRAAILVQAVFFGVIHSGYSTWAHVLAPVAFALAMAWITRILGLAAAMVVHAEIDALAFVLALPTARLDAWLLLAALLAANLVLAIATRFDAIRRLWRSLANGFKDADRAST